MCVNEFFEFVIRDKAMRSGTRLSQPGLVLTNPILFLANKVIDQKFRVEEGRADKEPTPYPDLQGERVTMRAKKRVLHDVI